MRDATRPVGQQQHGRENKERGAFLPQLPHVLGQPRVVLLAEWIVLPADTPAVVAALHEIFPTLAVALIGVVIASEKVAVIIKSELLRIAQSAAEDFHVRTVWLT